MPGGALRTAWLAGACLIGGLTAAPAQADTLEEALAQAYLTNPTLLAARAQLRATDEGVPIERADTLPNVSGQATYTEYLYDSDGSESGPGRQLGGQVSLALPVYSGGGTRNAIRAAETRVLAGRADLRATASGVFSRVTAAYMDVILQEALVGLTANNVEVLSVTLQATSDRYEIGDLTRTDVAQAEARLALARSDHRTAQANLIGARETYVALIGKAPVDLQPPPPLPEMPANVENAVANALADNPDLLAARERADAAFYDIRVAGSTRMPRIEVFTGATYSDFLGSLPAALAQVTTNSASAATAGVRATVPLYQGGRPAALERQAQARASQTLEQTVATERDVIAQVRSAYSAWLAANEIITATSTAVEAAELALEGVRAEQTVGNRTILDILDAEQELLRARVQLVTARRNQYVAGFSLLAAMGRAEPEDLDLATGGPLYDPATNYERVRGIVWDWSQDPDPQAQSTRTIDIPPQTAEIPEAAAIPDQL